MASKGRSTARRDRHRKIIARGHPPCHICGRPIDYGAHWLDPNSFTIDHVTPLAVGRGDDLDTLDNIAAAHRGCNRAKGTRSNLPPPGTAYVTARTW